jgi:hypothetical protein
MSFLSKFKIEQTQAFHEFKVDQTQAIHELRVDHTQAIHELKVEQTQLATEIKHIHHTLEKLPCEERRKETEFAINQLKEEHHKIEIDLSGVKSTIEIMKNLLNPVANANSPLSLTEEGQEHATALDVVNVIEKNWEKIYKDLEENTSDKKRYDIQQYIIDNFPLKFNQYLEPDDIDNLKEYAFVKGKNMYYFFIIYSIITRDKYLIQKGLL